MERGYVKDEEELEWEMGWETHMHGWMLGAMLVPGRRRRLPIASRGPKRAGRRER